MNIQGWFPLGLTGLISLLSKGLSRVFSRPGCGLSWGERIVGWWPGLGASRRWQRRCLDGRAPEPSSPAGACPWPASPLVPSFPRPVPFSAPRQRRAGHPCSRPASWVSSSPPDPQVTFRTGAWRTRLWLGRGRRREEALEGERGHPLPPARRLPGLGPLLGVLAPAPPRGHPPSPLPSTPARLRRRPPSPGTAGPLGPPGPLSSRHPRLSPYPGARLVSETPLQQQAEARRKQSVLSRGFKTPKGKGRAALRSPDSPQTPKSPLEKTRYDTSLGLLTKKFIQLLSQSPDGGLRSELGRRGAEGAREGFMTSPKSWKASTSLRSLKTKCSGWAAVYLRTGAYWSSVKACQKWPSSVRKRRN